MNASNVGEVADLLAKVTETIEVVSNEELTYVVDTLENIVEVGDGSIEVKAHVLYIFTVQSSGGGQPPICRL